jgi:inorganic pyrophosphatase
VDRDEADDKIIAILENDAFWGEVRDIADLPEILIERLRHYFATYKLIPGSPTTHVSIESVYGADHAFDVVKAAIRTTKKCTEGSAFPTP